VSSTCDSRTEFTTLCVVSGKSHNIGKVQSLEKHFNEKCHYFGEPVIIIRHNEQFTKRSHCVKKTSSLHSAVLLTTPACDGQTPGLSHARALHVIICLGENTNRRKRPPTQTYADQYLHGPAAFLTALLRSPAPR